MNVDLICGFCESSFSARGSETIEPVMISFIQRFCNAHSVCGYMTPSGQDDSEVLTSVAKIRVNTPTAKRKIKSVELFDEEEDEDE